LRLWLQDGRFSVFHLAHEQLALLAQQLHADLDRLPLMLCRLCLFRLGIGSLQIDAFAPHEGYGLVYEEPSTGRRRQAAIRAVRTLGQPSRAADVPTDEEELLAVLLWFVGLDPALSVRLFSESENQLFLHDNPVGTGRHWKALSFVQPCPPLSDGVVVVLLSALLPHESLNPLEEITFWQSLAALKAEALHKRRDERER
jgi:hypothetical protein